MLIDDCIRDSPLGELLKTAQVFIFNQETTRAIRELTKHIPPMDIQKQFKPPYPVTWMEQVGGYTNHEGRRFCMSFGWLIIENPPSGDDYEIYLFSGMSDEPTECTEKLTSKDGKQRLWNISYGGMQDGVPILNQHPSEIIIEDYFWPVHAMQIDMFGLNFRELVDIKREDFTKLNKKRAGVSKLPLKDRNIVTIKLEERRYEDTGYHPEGDKRKSPRMHLRRGHFMKKNEEFIWRRAALVGNKNYIPKSYKVAES